MIRIHVPGFYDSDGGGPRWGDAQIIDDGKNFEVIDGYCGNGTTRLISRLKARGIKSPYLHISHAHGDHDEGIRKIINLKENGKYVFTPRGLYCYDPDVLKPGLSNSEIKSDYNYLKTIIAEAKARKIPVTYIGHGSRIDHGDIHIQVYRYAPTYEGAGEDPHGWAFVNDGSLCYWFPELSYFTSGDGPMEIYESCKKWGVKPKFYKIPHHGNNCPRSQANGMKSAGAVLCWDNDYSTSITDFLQYGRKRCIEAGIKYLSCHGDINAIFFRKRAVIYKHGQIYRYACSYNGAPTLEEPNLENVKMVLSGKAGTDDARVTYLLNRRMNPGLIQKEINELYKLIKG